MKRIYWKPRAVSRWALALIALWSMVAAAAVEFLPVRATQPFHEEKMAAARLAAEAMTVLKSERLLRGPEIDAAYDPMDSGLVGDPMTPVTSVAGHLIAKQISVNPNFAAVVVEMLMRAGVEAGDVVAVGCSGSFPALNACTYAALETLGAKPIIVSSAAASQWGANRENFLWVDMEKTLQEQKIFPFRSVAASLGGYEDNGLGMSEEARELVAGAIRRNGLPLIATQDFTESVEERMRIYQSHADGRQIKAYVNVGGGTVSVGRSLGKKMFSPGLNRQPPRRAQEIDGVMVRFARQGAPTIHLVEVQRLAERYGLATEPGFTMPEPGIGGVFIDSVYNRWLAAGGLVAILASFYAFVHSDIGFRILKVGGPRKEVGHPQPMV